MASNLSATITEEQSFSYIFTQAFIPSDKVVFWLIFVITLLLFLLKAIKYILKWKSRSLSTPAAIQHLDTLLRGVMAVIDQNKMMLAPTPSLQ